MLVAFNSINNTFDLFLVCNVKCAYSFSLKFAKHCATRYNYKMVLLVFLEKKGDLFIKKILCTQWGKLVNCISVKCLQRIIHRCR